jgi:endo-1,4-beta-xylanase
MSVDMTRTASFHSHRVIRWLLLWNLVVAAMLMSASNAAADDSIWQSADERIAQHRQAKATVIVTDADGTPIPHASVSIEQSRHAFLFGCNFFNFGKLPKKEDELAYREQFASLFNFATLPFYWPMYERERGKPQHEFTRTVAEWCRDHGIVPKGHPLAWNYSDPRWLPDDPAEIRSLQYARISDCVSHFRGLIDTWDVVNEATHFERENFLRRAPKMTRMWQATGRIEFVDQCFKLARKANPQATLLINDYRVDPAYEQLLKTVTERAGERPYNVIGLQSHMHGGVWSNDKIWEVCERYSRFDVPLHFTELTILSGVRNEQGTTEENRWPSTPQGESDQAEQVRRVYTMLFSHPAVQAITWWDFADWHAWQGAPAGLLRDDLTPKPAYKVLQELIKQRWWTSLAAKSDLTGRVTFRGFLGDYEVTAKDSQGTPIKSKFRLTAGTDNEIHLVLK